MASGAPSVLTMRLSVTKAPYHKPANKLQILTDAFPRRQTVRPSADGFRPGPGRGLLRCMVMDDGFARNGCTAARVGSRRRPAAAAAPSGRAVDALDVEDAGDFADRGHHLVEVLEVEDLDRDLDAAAVVRGHGRVRGADV